MPAPRVYRASAVVLRRINLGETDKIVTLFTREKGKLNAVAKGARRTTSRLSGATELFGHCRMLLAVGQNLDVVTQVEVKEAFPALRHSLDRIAAASYMAELADHFTEERHPNPDLFDLLLSGLYVLCGSDDVSLPVAAFSLQLLSASGYAPSLDTCARCHAVAADYPAFSAALGGAICRRCASAVEDWIRVAPETLEAARAMLRAGLPVASRVAVSGRALAQLLRIVRAFLAYRSDGPLRSARFLDELLAARQLRGSSP